MRCARAIALTVVLLLIVACSGGDNRLTKEEFLKQGNVICGRLKTIGIDSQGTDTVADAATAKKFVKETFVPETKKGIDELDGLRPPADLQQAVDAFIAHARLVVDTVDKQADTDPAAFLNDDTNPFAEVGKEAVSLGLTECG